MAFKNWRLLKKETMKTTMLTSASLTERLSMEKRRRDILTRSVRMFRRNKYSILPNVWEDQEEHERRTWSDQTTFDKLSLVSRNNMHTSVQLLLLFSSQTQFRPQTKKLLFNTTPVLWEEVETNITTEWDVLMPTCQLVFLSAAFLCRFPILVISLA